jgi:hypothetical protein
MITSKRLKTQDESLRPLVLTGSLLQSLRPLVLTGSLLQNS